MRKITHTSFDVLPNKFKETELAGLAEKKGAIIYDTDNNVNKYWNGSLWVSIDSGVPVNPSDNFIFVNTKSDLPDAVGNVITLLPEKTYYFTKELDLLGDRLVGGQDTVILGSSSENSSITSTGLPANEYLFYTDFTTPIRHITFKDHDLGIGINTSNTGAQPIALDWYGVNFNNLGVSLECGDIDNFILTVGAILNGGQFKFNGSVGTIGLNSSIFVGDGSNKPLVLISSTANVTRRFRTIYSAWVVFGSSQAVEIQNGATIPTEGFILDTCSFSGGGNYLPTLDHTSNASLFTNNTGIINSREVSQLYMNGNATATVINTSGVAVKIAGTTSSSPITSKFVNTDNRATYVGGIAKSFKVVCTLSVESGNNNQIGIYIAKNGVLIPESEVYGTTSGAGRAENIVVQAFVSLQLNDYIELWIENDTGTQNIVVTDLNLVVD